MAESTLTGLREDNQRLKQEHALSDSQSHLAEEMARVKQGFDDSEVARSACTAKGQALLGRPGVAACSRKRATSRELTG